MSGLEGHIEVVLGCDGGRVAEVSVVSHRPAAPGRMFVGRRPDEVVAMLPLLFSLCGHAQLIAGLNALERASGLAPSAATVTARRLMLAAETVLEHAMGAVRDWPALLGEAPDLVAARGLRAALGSLRGALYPGTEWARIGGGDLAPDADDIARRLAEARRLIDRAIFAGPAEYQLSDLRNWTDWTHTGATAAARLVRHIEDHDAGGLGAGPVPFLPAVDEAALDRALAADDGSFLARPTWNGTPAITHPLARQAAHPLVAALLLTHGPGVLPLIAARLVDLQACLAEAEYLTEQLGHPSPACGRGRGPAESREGEGLSAQHFGKGTPPHPDPLPQAGEGVGIVQAARGLLAHRVELSDGLITRYQILAPTEWNFHPDGALAHGLRGLAADDRLAALARLVVAALDPCVACSVQVTHKSKGVPAPNVQVYGPMAGSFPTLIVG